MYHISRTKFCVIFNQLSNCSICKWLRNNDVRRPYYPENIRDHINRTFLIIRNIELHTLYKVYVQFIQMWYLLVKVTYGDCMVHYVIHSCMYLSRWDSVITHLGEHWSRALWIRSFSLHSARVVPSFLIINLFCHCSAVILSKGYKFDSNGYYTYIVIHVCK